MKPAKCRSCKQPVDRKVAVRVGGSRYHDTCAERRLKSRQRWDGKQWVHEGRSF